jgi:hypothetical protein
MQAKINVSDDFRQISDAADVAKLFQSKSDSLDKLTISAPMGEDVEVHEHTSTRDILDAFKSQIVREAIRLEFRDETDFEEIAPLVLSACEFLRQDAVVTIHGTEFRVHRGMSLQETREAFLNSFELFTKEGESYDFRLGGQSEIRVKGLHGTSRDQGTVAVMMANMLGLSVQWKFGSVELHATPDTSVEEIVDRYRKLAPR